MQMQKESEKKMIDVHSSISNSIWLNVGSLMPETRRWKWLQRLPRPIWHHQGQLRQWSPHIEPWRLQGQRRRLHFNDDSLYKIKSSSRGCSSYLFLNFCILRFSCFARGDNWCTKRGTKTSGAVWWPRKTGKRERLQAFAQEYVRGEQENSICARTDAWFFSFLLQNGVLPGALHWRFTFREHMLLSNAITNWATHLRNAPGASGLRITG